ncbi:aspartate aminotransferase family protein [Kineosporia sp. J2-2]|uniref:Aspartate aminotransferase family protein n=1 Tax=Kineosporia corallincola TaxID=2835133 RepID=A0ABS5TG19_9ACTN|nr:aspartate aminotransferase family protein [Kineosporia corallincola]MBT0770041.1 aspartate aminotransferase family protein [Kineosporia corallincola]
MTVDAGKVFERMRAHLPPRLALTGSFAGQGAVEASAQGSRVTLSDGRRALDFGSYAVALLGHRHPDVVAAVRAQLDVMPTSTRTLANPAAAEAAAALSGYFGDVLPRVYLGLNGSDTVEVATKLARLVTGRRRVLAVEGAFHGKTLGALALTHRPEFRRGLEGSLAECVHVAADDPDAVERYVRNGDVAALVVEPVQGENGVRALDRRVLAAWCASAGRHGTPVIADEIQCGLRRCGERSLALTWGLPVDAVLVGKPLGGGVVPLSGAVFSERLYRPLTADPFLHSATFGGHPLSCAALPAALRAIEELAPRGRQIETAMRTGLRRIAAVHPHAIAGVRGRGLLWGLDLTGPALAGELMVGLAAAGLLVSPCLSRPTTLRLMPPLVASDADLAEALAVLDAQLTSAARATVASGTQR